MAELKTKPTKASVTKFLNDIEDPQQRADAKKIHALMRTASGKRAKMWGESIVGYDEYTYEYASGRSGSWPRIGFSPRKRDLTLYIMPGVATQGTLLTKLGKHKTGKSCLYIKRLSEVDETVLTELIESAVATMKRKYG